MKNTILFILCLLAGLSSLQGQITIIPTISPPFSPYFEDYLKFENQQVMILVNTSNRRQEIKLTASIQGDNGYYANIREDFQPPNPIVLEPLETRSLTPRSPEFSIFDQNAVETNIPERTQIDLLASGILPEGNYTFCVQALDYTTSVPLSQPAPAGCAFIPISYMLPPVLMNPICESTVYNRLPSFLWSPPVGNPGRGSFLYDLYIMKLTEGQDPNIAMDRAVEYRAGNPLIIENIPTNNYVYRPSDPILEHGVTYVMQVVVRDPMGGLLFENNGRSPVCTFQYVEERQNSTQGSGPTRTDIIAPTGLITQLSGQLRYHFPGKTKKQKPDALDIAQLNNQTLSSGEGSPGDAGLYQVNTYGQPLFFDENLKPTNNTSPLANLKVKLVIHYVLNGYEVLNSDKVKLSYNGYVLPKDGHPYHPADNGKTVAVTYTDAQGNYQFSFPMVDSMKILKDFSSPATSAGNYGQMNMETSWENGGGVAHVGDYFSQFKFTQLVRVLRLEVESPYYASPEINMLVQPGQQAQVPTQVSEVRSYHLQVKAFGDTTADRHTDKHRILQGVQIEVLRQTAASAEIPPDEGQEVGEAGSQGWEVISRGKTNLKGLFLFAHLVSHDHFSPNDKYRIRAYTPQSNTLDYYESEWNPYPFSSSLKGLSALPYSSPGSLANSESTPKLYQTEIVLQAGKPKITGQVIHVVPNGEIGLADVRVNLVLSHTQGGKDLFNDHFIFTDKDGFFEFTDLPADHSGTLTFYKFGYHQETIPVQQLFMGDQFSPNDGIVKLVPYGKVYGYVSNEKGEPIPADVKLAEGPFSPTKYVVIAGGKKQASQKDRFMPPPGTYALETAMTQTGTAKYRFMFGAQSGQGLPLRIEPFSDKYFPLDTLVDVDMKLDKHFKNSADYQFLGEFRLKEKLHRVKFVIKDEKGDAVSGAKIEIQDTVLNVGKGTVKYAFASPGQFFLVKVIPDPQSNFVSWYEEIEIPISPDYQTIEIVLRKGYSISGIVTAGADSLPLANARVFIKDNLFWNNGFPVSETTSDAEGKFTLKGIPVDTLYTAGGNAVPAPVEILAVKADPQISYVGAKGFAKLPQKKQMHLHLDIISTLNLTRIWGMPIEVEAFTPTAQGGGKLTGAFVDLADNGNFSVKDKKARLSFYQIDVRPGPQKDAQGVAKVRPVQEEVLTEQTSLVVKVFENYTGKMYSRDYYQIEKGAERIIVGHDGAENGLIHGNVGILLSSFNFSYQYEGRLILADKPDETVIPVFGAREIPRRSYHLVDYKRGSILRDPAFQVHHFKATADRSKSFIEGDSVHLFTILHTNIPDSKPADLKIEAGEIVILPDDILPFSSGKSLTFHLEEWKIASQSPWYYNKNQGAIVIAKGMVHTGVIDVPVKNIRLQPDDLDIDDPDLQQSGLSLGGVLPLEVYTSNFIFGYDKKCGSDLKPHWKLRLINEGSQPAGMFTGLPGAENQKIYLDHISLFSNGEQIVGGLDDTVRFYNIMNMHLNQIATGNGFFKLRGRIDLGIPNLSTDLSSEFTYTNGPNGSIKSQWEPLSFVLDTKGKVAFHAENNNQFLSKGLYSAPGTIRIYSPDGEINLKGRLTRSTSGCMFRAIQVNGENQEIELGDPDHKMVMLKGESHADLSAGNWGKFSFDARMEGFKGIGGGKNPDKEMTFVVEGDITATDQDISITDINTPLGGLQLIYNFKEQSLFGAMHVNEMDVGALAIKSGDFQILLDRKGYYFLLGAQVKVPIVETIGMALLIGDYPEFTPVMRSTFENYSYNHNIPPGFENGFSGFLFNGKWEYEIFDNDGIDLAVVSVYATAKVGLDLRVSADFSENAFELYVLGYGNFGLEVSAFCITGFFVLNAELGIGAQIVNGNFDLKGCASIQAGVGYEACVPIDPLAIVCLDVCTSDCWTGSIKADLTWGESSSTPDFEVSFGETCSNNKDVMNIGNQSGNPCN